MILHPAILALLLSSTLISAALLFAAWWGVVILRRWDLRSGSELQLALERRTYLVSTLLSYAFAFELGSLVLYVFTADRLSVLFVGAMCAAGTLHANAFGYPTLFLKIVNALLAGVWLVLHFADTRAYDYPLLRAKYGLLLALTPLVLAEAYLQARFFTGLEPDLVTSCCGSLFGLGTGSLSSDLASLPLGPTRIAFFACVLVTLALGGLAAARGRGAGLFSVSSLATFFVSAASLVSFISIYVYQLPTHHCPFCLLQAGSGYVGYLFYAGLMAGGIFGLGVGALEPFRGTASLATLLPSLRRRLIALSCLGYATFAALAAWYMTATTFRP